MSFIYFFERHPKHGESSAGWFRRIASGDVSAVVSALVLTEILVPYFAIGRDDLAGSLASEINAYPNLRMVDADQPVVIRAARLRARYSLRTPDAIHLATALEHGADWFVTNDRRLKRVEPEGIRIWLYEDEF